MLLAWLYSISKNESKLQDETRADIAKKLLKLCGGLKLGEESRIKSKTLFFKLSKMKMYSIQTSSCMY
jgi:hypothetical protein